MRKIKDIQSAVELFIVHATKQAEATENGDYKTGNNCYNRIAKAVEFLKENDSIVSLHPLLKNPSIGVRLWSAAYLLSLHEKEASDALDSIKKTTGIHSLTAETTLNEWRKGNLKL